MLRLLIVDDEKTTREALAEHIPWCELGIDIVRTARNGLEALEMIKQSKPDIILTDVRMPKMDGVELVKALRPLAQACKVIFLSGFADKEYLKSAIQYKALSYIEKPINIDEVVEVITKAVNLCREETEKQNALDKLLREKRTIMRQEMARELAAGNAEVLKTAFEDGGLSLRFLPDGIFTAAYVVLNWRNGLNDKLIEGGKQTILRLLADDTLCDSSDVIAGFDGNRNLVMITAGRIDAAASDASNVFCRLAERLEEIAVDHYSYSVGVGDSVKGLGTIKESFATACLAATKQFYFGANHVFYYSRHSHPDFTLDKNNFVVFKKHLETDVQAKAKEIVDNLTAEIQAGHTYDINRVKNIYFHLLLIIFDTALARGLIDPFGDKEQNYIWQEIEAINSLADLAGYVTSSIQSILGCGEEKDAANGKVRKIECYILSNFADHKLSVQGIANHVYLSPTYLCAFYKKCMGKTLNEFITEIRMEKAKELLKGSPVKLYEVALNVGFTDPEYFSTLFKRYVGCTPSEFKGK